jgi:hypothetical protein
LILLLALTLNANAANVRNYMLDPFTGQVDTNALIIRKISTNILSNGGVIGIGVPQRTPSSPWTNTLAQGFYSVSNAALRSAYVINVTDSGSTLYDATNILHSGFNTYVTVYPGGSGTSGALTNNDTRNITFGGNLTANSGNEQQLILNDSDGFVITNTANVTLFKVSPEGVVTANGAGITNIAQSGVSGLANSLDFLTNNAATQAQLATNGLPALWVAADTVVSNGLSARIIATNNAILNLVPIRTFVAGTNIVLLTNSSTLTIHGTATGGSGTSGALTNNETRNVVLLGDLSTGGGQEQQMTINESAGFVLTNTANASHFSVSPEGVVTGNGSGITNIASAGLAAGLTGTGALVASNAPTIYGATLVGTTTLDELSVGELQLPFASALAKTDASSNLVAAVAGTDYVAPGGTIGITNAIVFTDANGVPVKTLAAPTNTASAGQVLQASSASTTGWATPTGGTAPATIAHLRFANLAYGTSGLRYVPLAPTANLATMGATDEQQMTSTFGDTNLTEIVSFRVMNYYGANSLGVGTNITWRFKTNGVSAGDVMALTVTGSAATRDIVEVHGSLPWRGGTNQIVLMGSNNTAGATVAMWADFWIKAR